MVACGFYFGMRQLQCRSKPGDRCFGPYMGVREGGKSGLQRAGYSVTRSEGNLKESATENTQPTRF